MYVFAPDHRSSEVDIGFALEVWLRLYVKSSLFRARAGPYG